MQLLTGRGRREHQGGVSLADLLEDRREATWEKFKPPRSSLYRYVQATDQIPFSGCSHWMARGHLPKSWLLTHSKEMEAEHHQSIHTLVQQEERMLQNNSLSPCVLDERREDPHGVVVRDALLLRGVHDLVYEASYIEAVMRVSKTRQGRWFITGKNLLVFAHDQKLSGLVAPRIRKV